MNILLAVLIIVSTSFSSANEQTPLVEEAFSMPLSSVARGWTPRQSNDEVGPDRFSNPSGCFSRNRQVADRCSHPDWRELSIEERGKYIQDALSVLISAHEFNVNPNVMVCVTFHESRFETQIQNPVSSARGLGQVIRSSASAVFSKYVSGPRGQQIRPLVAGFQEIQRGAEYHDLMATSPLAQLEMALFIFQANILDSGTARPERILPRYIGSSQASVNQAYTRRILSCSRCLDAHPRDEVTLDCLRRSVR